MLPSLPLGPWQVPTYALAVVASFVVASWVRRREVQRLGYDAHPSHPWVGIGGLLGGIVGAKLGLVLFAEPGTVAEVLAGILSLDFTGKTILGGIAGGYIGVELAKSAVGIRFSTGDGFALALPIGQAIGRLGCMGHGCCYGTPFEGAGALFLHGAWRHPTPLYEAGLDVLLAALLFGLRRRTTAPGQLFRLYLIGYAAIRFALDPLRADGSLALGPLSAVQWFCAAVIVGFGLALWTGRR
ncbi:MAG: prolipoprotein diacylglyceryl transferase [Myxococcales bacterium]|nr:prolipoprotein diacylglyceryl transferase [Myxococcales bacterium]